MAEVRVRVEDMSGELAVASSIARSKRLVRVLNIAAVGMLSTFYCGSIIVFGVFCQVVATVASQISLKCLAHLWHLPECGTPI